MNVSITFAIRLLTAPTMKALTRANVKRDIQETGKSALKVCKLLAQYVVKRI